MCGFDRGRGQTSFPDDFRHVIEQRGCGDVGPCAGPRVALRAAFGVDDDAVGHSRDEGEWMRAREERRTDVRADLALLRATIRKFTGDDNTVIDMPSLRVGKPTFADMSLF